MKQCRKCKLEKEETEFYSYQNNGRCKACHREDTKKYNKKRKIANRIASRERYRKAHPNYKIQLCSERHILLEKNKETLTGICSICGPVKLNYRKSSNKFRCSIVEKDHGNTIKRKLCVSNEWFKNKLKEQNNLCEICKKTNGDKQLCIDHNHITNDLRGLICNNCNLLIGHCKENIEILKNAIKYLEKYNGTKNEPVSAGSTI